MIGKTRTLVVGGLLAALAFALMFFVEFPLPMLPVWLKYDPSEVPALMAAFALGPWAGLAVVFTKDLLFFVSGKGSSGLIGISANFVAGGSLVVVAGLVYQRMRNRAGALLGLSLGTLAMTAVMTAANYAVFIPLYLGPMPSEEVVALLTAAIVPFNLVKGLFSSVLGYVLYLRVAPLLGEQPAPAAVARPAPRTGT